MRHETNYSFPYRIASFIFAGIFCTFKIKHQQQHVEGKFLGA